MSRFVTYMIPARYSERGHTFVTDVSHVVSIDWLLKMVMFVSCSFRAVVRLALHHSASSFSNN
jgi:hypothetical protein